MKPTNTQQGKTKNGWYYGRVPDDGEAGDVLVFTRQHITYIGYWDGFYWHYDDGRCHIREEVIAWRPLPEPPYEVMENV